MIGARGWSWRLCPSHCLCPFFFNFSENYSLTNVVGRAESLHKVNGRVQYGADLNRHAFIRDWNDDTGM